MSNFYSLNHFNDDWATPDDLYKLLDKEFCFVDDPCPLNGVGGLEREWKSPCFVNPPYSDPNPWIYQAVYEQSRGKTVVMLLKSDTSTKVFHEIILPYSKEIRFIKGRLKYKGGKWTAPFPSMVVIF